MTPEQRELARHALGLPNREREAYRNFYSIEEGGDGYEEWRQMVAAGEAIHRPAQMVFHLTRAGVGAAIQAGEFLSISTAAGLDRIDSYKVRVNS